jgi:hypothetical protein
MILRPSMKFQVFHLPHKVFECLLLQCTETSLFSHIAKVLFFYPCPVCIVYSVSYPTTGDSSLEGPHRKENILIIQTQHESLCKSMTPTSILNHFAPDMNM